MNTVQKLREMAEKILAEHPRDFKLNEWSGNFKNLLEELSIYQIELEHQNKELEHSEKLLGSAHEEYVKLFESTPVGYLLLDENRNIIRANQTFIYAFVSPKFNDCPIEGVTFDNFITEEFKNAFAVFCKMALSKNTIIPMELKMLDRHDMPRYILLTARVYDSEKKIIALATSDISMLKAMEEQLVKAKEEEENANRQKSRFITNVNQELRTPLTTIIGCKEIINDPNTDDSEKLICCREMINACEMLQVFSDRILDVTALENGDTKISPKIVDIKKTCEETVGAFDRRLHEKNITLNLKIAQLPCLWIDQFRLKQIIVSVLEHAIRNASNSEILFECDYAPGYDRYGTLHLHFTGHEIFTSENDFLRHNNRAVGVAGSDSLNMFITKRVVNALNGQMTWKHPLDSLWIEIPANTIPVGFSELIEKGTIATGEKTDQDNEKTCLLVDDVMMNLKILSLMMKKLGYKPTLTTCAKEANKLAFEHKFDLVLTDLWMPEINGEDLAIALRQNPNYDNTPIYAVTADVEFGTNFSMDFFNGTIIKPVSLDKLKKVIMTNQNNEN